MQKTLRVTAQYELVRKAQPTSVHFEWHAMGIKRSVPMVEVMVYGYSYGAKELDVKLSYYSGAGDQEYARAMAAALLDASATMDAIYKIGVGIIDQVWAETFVESDSSPSAA
jgi:hypothetical protein